MRLKSEGTSLPDIRTAIDAKYLRFGPPTLTPRPQ
jgi:hypothetical protein